MESLRAESIWLRETVFGKARAVPGELRAAMTDSHPTTPEMGRVDGWAVHPAVSSGAAARGVHLADSGSPASGVEPCRLTAKAVITAISKLRTGSSEPRSSAAREPRSPLERDNCAGNHRCERHTTKYLVRTARSPTSPMDRPEHTAPDSR